MKWALLLSRGLMTVRTEKCQSRDGHRVLPFQGGGGGLVGALKKMCENLDSAGPDSQSPLLNGSSFIPLYSRSFKLLGRGRQQKSRVPKVPGGGRDRAGIFMPLTS